MLKQSFQVGFENHANFMIISTNHGQQDNVIKTISVESPEETEIEDDFNETTQFLLAVPNRNMLI